jgi:GNAT superfamily N-acetyltransferase
MPVETLRERAKRGELYLCERDGEVVGTVALKDSEPELWGEDEGDCLYLHTLAVRPDLRGSGLARWMLNWVETFAGERHRSRVRLDCLAELDSLRRYYREAGYTELGIKRMNETWVAALFEKELGR